MNRNLALIGLMVSTLLYAFPVAAEEKPNEKGWYGGLGIAQNVNGLTKEYLNSGTWNLQNPTETSADNQSLGFAVYGGWRFSKYWALDVSYVNFGETNYHLGSRQAFYPSPPPGACYIGCTLPPLYPPSDYSLEATALRAAVRGSFPIGERWTLDGLLGLGVEAWKSHGDSGDSDNVSEPMAMFGIGSSYSVNEHWRLRLDWDWYVPVNTNSAYDGSSPYRDIPNASHGTIYEALTVNSLALNIEYRL
jgi:hypothetical protein